MLAGFQNADIVADHRFSGGRLVLVDQPAQDHSTPDPAGNRPWNSDVRIGGRGRSARCGRRAL